MFPPVEFFLKLPACFSDSRDLTLVSEFSEADTANTIFSEISMRASADFAAVILSHLELLRAGLPDLH
jgi:hypothetical protein